MRCKHASAVAELAVVRRLVPMRKQYHFRPSERGLLAWDVDRLVAMSKEFPRVQVSLATIRELDEPFWFGLGNTPTCRAVVEHARLIEAADLSFPIILSSDGRVMDGMHPGRNACCRFFIGDALFSLALTARRPHCQYSEMTQTVRSPRRLPVLRAG